ncbi:histone deacetylase complex subunit SAP130-A-like [Physella acuta]|uniref:histone deacetylase complex subunit SAP130-A-like n=1 Tax=Physella acuta TaxID=109671 RepID=UPI0027DAC714|nr:histone deacetylase complex subunit SAP130-A-like [Physella acuta]
MSKIKPGGSSDRKGDGVVDGEPSRLMNSQIAAGLHSGRAVINSQTNTAHTYSVSPHQEMKNFGKPARPIAPAPPSQGLHSITTRNVQVSQANIPNIISPALGPTTTNETIMNLVATTSSAIGTINHNSQTVPVTPSQANILQLNSASMTSSVVQQGITGSPIPISMIRSANSNQQTPMQQSTHNFSNLQRAATTLPVPKSNALLRPSNPSTLQMAVGLSTGVNPPLSLPQARTPIYQNIKTTTGQTTRSQSPAIGGQSTVQPQPQDLSRANYPLHGSIASVTPGSLPVHITLNRLASPFNSEANQGRVVSSQLQNDLTSSNQQRLNTSLSTDTNVHQRSTPDLNRTALFVGQSKNNTNLTSQTKVISSQTIIQQGTPIKTVTINSINPSQVSTTTAAAPPIPVAKVTPQRLHSVGSILTTSLPAHAVSSGTVLSSITATHTNTVATLSSAPLSSALLDVGRHDQSGLTSNHPSSGGIIISSEYQPRPPNAIITLATTVTTSSVVPQTDNRSTHQMGIAPDDSMWMQHYIYHQPSTIVRPGTGTFYLPSQGKIQNQSSGIAASQLAAMSVASSNVRFNTGTITIDQLRHQQQTIHSSFNTNTASNGLVDKSGNLSRTQASSNYTTSVGVQSQAQGGGCGTVNVSSGPSTTSITNPSSSPRPSILRKRPSEAAGVVIRKPNFNLNQDTRCHSPPRVDTNSSGLSSPKLSTKNFSPMSENSQSSTDTALSSNDATTPTHNHVDKGKGEGEDCVENGPPLSAATLNNIPASPAVSHTGSLSEASPRKRARKQLLHANEELKDNITSSDDENESNHHIKDEITKEQKDRDIKGEYTDEEGVRWILNKPKPTFVLLQPEFFNSKTRNNHFTRYSDVKPKDERRPTVHELSNQRGITQKVNGWKLYFTASQLEELMDVEKDMQEQFSEVQAALAQIPSHKISSDEAIKIHEMSQANIQRCQLIQNQLTDARTSMIRTLEHKSRIQEIVNKHVSKRPIKKKERS